MAAVFFATLKEYEMQQTWRDSEDRRPAAPPPRRSVSKQSSETHRDAQRTS